MLRGGPQRWYSGFCSRTGLSPVMTSLVGPDLGIPRGRFTHLRPLYLSLPVMQKDAGKYHLSGLWFITELPMLLHQKGATSFN